LTCTTRNDKIRPLIRLCPHRLEAQDATLSRSKLEFESPWGHQQNNPPELAGLLYSMLFEGIIR
jgi:hypothetical protein